MQYLWIRQVMNERMKLSDIIKETEYISVSGDADITDITNNSRDVKPGSIFVCIKGFKSDGHKYIPQARESGAAAIVVTEDVDIKDIPVVKVADARKFMAQASHIIFGKPSEKMVMIGVTGTNGKTTVTHLIKSIISLTGEKTGLIGTNSIVIGDESVPAEFTTPESCVLHKIFAQMAEKGVKYCIMEVSSHSIELMRVYGIKFKLGVFTNLTHDHLDLHGTMENYMSVKAKLFENCEISVINTDDDYGKRIAENIKEKTTYSIDEKSDFTAENIRLSDKGIIYETGGMQIKAMMPGRFSVYNTLAAAVACMKLGISPETVQKGLIISKGAKGRAQVLQTGMPFKVMIDFAHTPDGLCNILTTVKEYCTGKLIIVFGAAGDRDKKKRPEMGRVVSRYADFAVVTSDNPASEEPEDIINQVCEGISISHKCITDRKEAIHFALDMAKENDIVLLAGKGHETYQIVKDGKIPFSEEEIVKEYSLLRR